MLASAVWKAAPISYRIGTRGMQTEAGSTHGKIQPAGTGGQAANARLLPIALLATVLIPGSGHFLLGRRVKGIVYAVALLGLIAVGLDLGDNCNFTDQANERHPVMYVVQFCGGGPAALAYATRPKIYPAGAFSNPKLFETAVLFTCIAGLLNLLLLIDLAGTPARDRLKSRLATVAASQAGKEQRSPTPAHGGAKP